MYTEPNCIGRKTSTEAQKYVTPTANKLLSLTLIARHRRIHNIRINRRIDQFSVLAVFIATPLLGLLLVW